MTTARAVITTLAIYLGTGFALDTLLMARATARPVLDELVSVLALGYVGLGATALIAGHLHVNVMVPVGEEPEHRGVIDGTDHSESAVA